MPEKYTFWRDNPAERRETGLLYRFTSGMIYAMGFSNVSLGIARGALEAFIELARDKIPRGARKTLRENNVIQSEVAQCEAKLRSSRASIHATLQDMWADAERDGEFLPERHWQLRLAATWAIQQAAKAARSISKPSARSSSACRPREECSASGREAPVVFRSIYNIFVERLWRSLKYEEVYLDAYASVAEAKAGIGAWLDFYNAERQHQSLGIARHGK